MEQFLTNFLENYGLWAALVWALIETDIIFLVIGAFAAAGKVSLLGCFGGAVFSALLHDTVLFWLAHHRAEWARSTKMYQKVGSRVESLAKKVGPWELMLCRPLYGTRYPSILFWGLQRLSYRQFWITDGTGLLIWAALLTALGYFLGDELDDLKDWVMQTEKRLLGVLVVVGLVFAAISWWKKKRRPQTVPVREPENAA